MTLFNQYFAVTVCGLLLNMLVSFQLHAHMMVAQHGTLNLKGNGVFMVLSLPITAFNGIDDDNDGKLSVAEFNSHKPMIAKAVNENVVLSDQHGKRLLQGMMLSPVTSHHISTPSDDSTASQIVIMGRFSLADDSENLQYQVSLFGNSSDEKLMKITATHEKHGKTQAFELTPENTIAHLFSEENN